MIKKFSQTQPEHQTLHHNLLFLNQIETFKLIQVNW